MSIRRPEIQINDASGKKLTKSVNRLNDFVDALNKKELTEEVMSSSNDKIDEIATFEGTESQLARKVNKTYAKILSEVEKKLGLVPKNHFRRRWMALGMSVFGIPIGVALSTSSDNTAFIGVGIPIGMAVGIAIGTSMDANAEKKGKQLDV